MKITYLGLPTRDLQTQMDFYANVLGLPVKSLTGVFEVQAGETRLIFTQADPNFNGADHFAFNIPENQFDVAKKWISSRASMLTDAEGRDEFASGIWNSHSVYFKDPADNMLEFIARHNLKNAVEGSLDGDQILSVSEIGLPSQDVIGRAKELCARLGVSVFKQEPDKNFTPVGDDNGLLILPVKDRIWIPNSGVPAGLLPVRVKVDVDGKTSEIRGYPYEIIC